jgi:hypothetical protein
MPRLGEPVEPDHVERVEPWWSGVDDIVLPPQPEPHDTLPKAMPWPID